MIESEEGRWLPITPNTPTTDRALVDEIYEFCESYTPVSPQSRIIVRAEPPLLQETSPEAEETSLLSPIDDQ